MHVGTVAAGRIGLDALRKLKHFDVHMHYFDRHRLPESVEKELNLTFHDSVESMVAVCDVVQSIVHFTLKLKIFLTMR